MSWNQCRSRMEGWCSSATRGKEVSIAFRASSSCLQVITVITAPPPDGLHRVFTYQNIRFAASTVGAAEWPHFQHQETVKSEESPAEIVKCRVW